MNLDIYNVFSDDELNYSEVKDIKFKVLGDKRALILMEGDYQWVRSIPFILRFKAFRNLFKILRF
jgi:hypothetical protein